MRPAVPAPSGSHIPVADVTSAFSSVFAALTVALAAIYVAAPEVRTWLGAAHGLIAWFAIGAFAAATILGVWAARRALTESRFRLVVPLLALWGLLDQVRYLVPLLPGDLPGGSYGDVGAALADWAVPLGIGAGLGMAIIAAVVLGAAAVRHRVRRWAEGRTMVTEGRVVDFVVGSGALLAAAPFVMMFGAGDGPAFAARLATMTGATALVLAALAAGDHRRTVAGWRGRMRPWIGDPTRPPVSDAEPHRS